MPWNRPESAPRAGTLVHVLVAPLSPRVFPPPGLFPKISGLDRSCTTRSATGASTIISPVHCMMLKGEPNRKHEITTLKNCRKVITDASVTAPKQKMVYEMANWLTAALTDNTKTSWMAPGWRPRKNTTWVIWFVLNSHISENNALKQVVKKIWFRIEHV